MAELIGKKIVAFRGRPTPPITYRDKVITPGKCLMSIILFDDNKTYMEFFEQDQYDYHDCNSDARTISVSEDAEQWQKMFDKVGYDEPTHFDF